MIKSNFKEQNKQKINMYQSSEAIIKNILDKIINLSVKKSYSNKIDSELGKFCFNYMKESITNMFELNYITHTKESLNTKTIINDNKAQGDLLFKRKKPKNNTWIEILEPNNIGPDRCEGLNINYKELPCNEEDQNYSNKSIHNKKNIKPKNKKSIFSVNNNIDNIHNIPAKKSSKKLVLSEKKESNKNLIIENNVNKVISTIETNIKQNTIIPKENNISQSKRITINNTNNTKNNIQSKSNNPSIKKKKMEIVEFTYQDLPNLSEDPSAYDLSNVELLRKEYEESLVKKEEDRKKQKIDEENEKKILKIFTEKKNKKIFDSNKLTFDSNGKIISFRQYKTDNLKDFIIPKNFIKETKKSNLNIANPTPKKAKNNNGNNIVVTNSKTPKKNLLIKEDIIKNETNIHSSTKFINRLFEKIIPSGSNYQIMSPEIGVTIMENGQSKEGSKEFSKYFKKYSFKDYDEMLKEHLPNINKNFLKTSLLNTASTSKRKSIKKSILNMNNNIQPNITERNSKDYNKNNNLNTSEDISIYNPLISSPKIETSLVEKDIINTYNHKMIDSPIKNNMLSSRRTVLNNNNPLLSSIYNNNVNSSNLYTTNFDNFITMKKSGINSLKLELDSLKDLTENKEGLYSNEMTIRNNDFIGEKFRIKNHSLIHKKNHYKNYFGDFNKKIITNKRWGNELTQRFNNNNSNISTVYSKHQTNLQILRELGNNILIGNKIKLPRNRKVKLITSNNNNY